MSSAATAPAAVVDVRTIVPQERHKRIFSQFDALEPGQSLLLVNDHDPVPLHHQFQSRTPGQFDWTYVESGPVWQVQIRKLAASSNNSSCCSGGACCG